MVHGKTSPGDDSSSSGFSSDEDIEDVAVLPSVPFYTPEVHVEVVNEGEETDLLSTSISLKRSLETEISSFNVRECCQEAAYSILQTATPLNVQYEQYTAAINHVTSHWPSLDTVSSDEELAKRLKSYHSLRSRLYRIFQQAFPLTEDMYLQWISDASALDTSIEQLKTIFKLAQGDYWSVPLTLKYLKLVKENGDDAELKEAMKWAQATLGMHFARGHEIWALCRELTIETYEARENEPETALEKERAIRDLFSMQLQLPLDQNDLVMSEFRSWHVYNTLDAAASGSVVEAASKCQTTLFAPLMKKMRGFEAKISAVGEDAAAAEEAWLQYVNFVKHRVAPLLPTKRKQLVVCLYERAVSGMCLSSTLWESYLEYIEAEADRYEKLHVVQRALRNVPFDSSIWIELLLEMEEMGTSVAKRTQFMRTELMSRSKSPMEPFHLLNVLLTWCDSIRRHVAASMEKERVETRAEHVESILGDVFTACGDYLGQVCPDFQEGILRLVQYQAKCLWDLLPSDKPASTSTKVTKLCDLWKTTLNTSLGNQAAAWIAYLESLRQMNTCSIQNLRQMVFDEARQRVTDFPLVLAESWLVFERENGDLASYRLARRFYSKHYATAQAVVAENAVSATSLKHNEGEKERKGGKKRKVLSAEAKGIQKRMKLNGPSHETKDQKTRDGAKAEKKQTYERTMRDEHTLFVCNVSKEATQEDLEAVFRDISSVKDVRLVVKVRGDRKKSRGMAYVQFTDESGVQAGLEKNGVLLYGRPVKIERSKPPVTSSSTSSQGVLDKFWKADPLTLYVGNLNRQESNEHVTEEQLQRLVQEAMQSVDKSVVVRRVSILKDRHEKLKNYGLVEFAEPSDVALCLKNVAAVQAKVGDQVTLKASRFSIAHILEQQEKQKKEQQEKKKKWKERGTTSTRGKTPHGKPTTRLVLPSNASSTSFVPRTLRRKAAAQGKEATKTQVGTTIPKSNEDFRMLLKR